MSTGEHPEAGLGELAAIDVLLRQGSPEAQAEVRRRAASEPDAMLAMAEVVALVGQFRTLRGEPTPAFAGKLADVVARAERRLLPPPRQWHGLPLALAAAIACFSLLWLWDPLRDSLPLPVAQLVPTDAEVQVEPPAPAMADVPPVVLDEREVAWHSDVERMRQRLGMESSPHLREALEAGLGTPSDALGRWLDPRNLLMRMRLDHELRADAGLRHAAMRQQGGIPAADARVQQLADAIGGQVLAVVAGAAAADVGDMALGVRALIAAGPGSSERDRALRAGGTWLAAHLADTNALDLVRGLAALVEATAVTGDHRQVVAQQGDRLLAQVLQVDGDNWSRRLPALLGPRVPAGVLADASRVLARLPGLGIDAGRCGIVRQLLLGPLRERRAHGEDSPELVAALLYGSADLLAESEREELELRLRRWKPVLLAPDFATVHQIAWAIEPGRRGFVRHQAELRQVAVCEDPQALGSRAALCLALATSYAAWAGGVLPRLAAGA